MRENHRRRAGRKTGVFYAAVLCVVMVAAVSAGCFSAKYLVAPWLFGKNTEVQDSVTEAAKEQENTEKEIAETNEKKNIVTPEKEQTASEEPEQKTEQVSVTRYTIQYGRFSTRPAAEEEAAKLKSLGISTEIRSAENQFVVTEVPFKTEQDARNALEQRRNAACAEAFITTVEENQT